MLWSQIYRRDEWKLPAIPESRMMNDSRTRAVELPMVDRGVRRFCSGNDCPSNYSFWMSFSILSQSIEISLNSAYGSLHLLLQFVLLLLIKLSKGLRKSWVLQSGTVSVDSIRCI